MAASFCFIQMQQLKASVKTTPGAIAGTRPPEFLSKTSFTLQLLPVLSLEQLQ